MTVKISKFPQSDAASYAAPHVHIIMLAQDGGLGPRARALDGQIHGAIGHAIKAAAFTGKQGACLDVLGAETGRIIVVGLGEASELGALVSCKVGAALAAFVEERGVTAARLLFELPAGTAITGEQILMRMLLGLRLRNYRFELMPQCEIAFDLDLQVDSDFDLDLCARADAIHSGVSLARSMVNFPASHLHPDNFSSYLTPLREAGIEIKILETEELERLGMNALLAVGNGSARKPKVIVLRYNGGAPSEAPIGLVGKGICFDAGGLIIKPSEGMFDMRGDMGGAAAVIGAMLTLALQKSPENIVGVLGVAENMLSGNSYKPGDIVTTMSGKTVEVYDTDCEGRMVLSDILYYTASQFKPRVMVDLATLTHSVMQGLGQVFAGVFATSTDLGSQMVAAGEITGERFWPLPLDHAYDEGLKSPVADLRQHARDLDDGDAPYAAAFLRHFTMDLPWMHLDIAGKEIREADTPLARRGALGFGVLALEEWISRGVA
ncbi:hypothetical protein P775_03610 [Puniceibacterium antarcticum]|uniref:Probable cytosol aminopeptidase n=1 Tax=Puniceibacterium antarcticum TaxID=1206336 RepID=A0A2G8RJC8_9RHOB|nr:leucyl aminopeptidase family protein [Puniceibacterium antarcticum]PIL21603.1 hypothetical protein P775_03610 [Puniceibacterium antarcticum]